MEEEIKEEVTEEENKQEEIEVKQEETPKKEKKKRKGIISIIISIILWIIVLIVLVSVVLGLINFNRISKDEEPIAVLDTRKIEEEDQNVTIYDFGVYRIEKTESAKNTTISLKPWFMSENK